MSDSIVSQLKRNTVALISLTVALLSLGYNTWRNESTEANRNQRTAAFQTLLQIGRLQELVFLSHYDDDQQRGNPRSGWALVLTVQDLALLLPATCQRSAEDLHVAWQANWSGLGERDVAAEQIIAAIDATRSTTQALLQSLE